MTATSSTLGMQFDPDKLDGVEEALARLGFAPGREDGFAAYGPECECTRFFELRKVPRAKTWRKKLAAEVRMVFEAHHAVLGELHLIARAGASVTHSEWRVLRYPNLGIRRDLKGVEEADAQMLTIGGKHRPVVIREETMPPSAFIDTRAYGALGHGVVD